VIAPVRANAYDYDILFEVFGDRIYDVDRRMPVRRIIDLGANTGLATLFFASLWPEAEIACVEPSPANAEVLKNTIELNRLHARVFQAAVGVSEGHATFFESTDPTCSTLIERSDASVSSVIDVPLITVPGIMKELGWTSVDLLKIDIEGYEKVLLSGRPAWLSDVRMIAGELHQGYSFEDCNRDLASFGFTLENRYEDATYGMCNFIATRTVPVAADA
jgi:FkbM family methyltransferase